MLSASSFDPQQHRGKDDSNGDGIGPAQIFERRITEENVRRHDAVAAKYETFHPEIFNVTEQRRLARELNRALDHVRTNHRRGLDYGCGTGNLTEKLLLRGMRIWAADVSSEMLSIVRERYSEQERGGSLTTVHLPLDLPLRFPDRHFAFVGAYSVLHHIPDYLGAVRELMRVLDRGGVIYIDHESNEDHWRSPVGVRLHRLLTMPSYSFGRILARLQALFGKVEPLLPAPGQRDVVDEGDVHIYSDDHIDWTAIRAIAIEEGLEQIPTADYLLCREMSRFPIRHWLCRHFACDTGMFIGYRPLS
jgi:ubiquinone/menaquinone biosynthesis C-methylase UbiE